MTADLETVAPDRVAKPKVPERRDTLASPPKIRAVYWCRFWKDTIRPEFHKTRPVVVVSRNNRLDGPIVVVPLTTLPQRNNRWAVKLSENLAARRPDVPQWAVCDHLYTVACSRLYLVRGGAPRLSPEEFDRIVQLIMQKLPSASGPPSNNPLDFSAAND